MKKRRVSKAAQIASKINTALGVEAVGFASDPRFVIEKIPSGSLTVDRVTGGGFPRGRHVELFGDEATAKSSIMYMTLALAQERGEVAALIDGEKVFEAAWFRHLGGDPDELLIFRPKEGMNAAEHVIEVLMLFAQGDESIKGVSVIGIDSVASLLPMEELKKQPTEGDDRTAGRARFMSRLLRRVTAVNDDTLFLWTNQVIDKVSGYGGTTTPGGRALKFYASVRLELKKLDRLKKPRTGVKKGKLTKYDKVVGQWVGVRAAKQKTATPEMEGTFLFDYEHKMIDREREILFLGLEDRLITRKGNTYRYEDSEGNEWTGLESRFLEMIHDNEDLSEELEWAITERSRSIGEDIDNDDDEED